MKIYAELSFKKIKEVVFRFLKICPPKGSNWRLTFSPVTTTWEDFVNEILYQNLTLIGTEIDSYIDIKKSERLKGANNHVQANYTIK